MRVGRKVVKPALSGVLECTRTSSREKVRRAVAGCVAGGLTLEEKGMVLARFGPGGVLAGRGDVAPLCAEVEKDMKDGSFAQRCHTASSLPTTLSLIHAMCATRYHPTSALSHASFKFAGTTPPDTETPLALLSVLDTTLLQALSNTTDLRVKSFLKGLYAHCAENVKRIEDLRVLTVFAGQVGGCGVLPRNTYSMLSKGLVRWVEANFVDTKIMVEGVEAVAEVAERLAWDVPGERKDDSTYSAVLERLGESLLFDSRFAAHRSTSGDTSTGNPKGFFPVHQGALRLLSCMPKLSLKSIVSRRGADLASILNPKHKKMRDLVLLEMLHILQRLRMDKKEWSIATFDVLLEHNISTMLLPYYASTAVILGISDLKFRKIITKMLESEQHISLLLHNTTRHVLIVLAELARRGAWETYPPGVEANHRLLAAAYVARLPSGEQSLSDFLFLPSPREPTKMDSPELRLALLTRSTSPKGVLEEEARIALASAVLCTFCYIPHFGVGSVVLPRRALVVGVCEKLANLLNLSEKCLSKLALSSGTEPSQVAHLHSEARHLIMLLRLRKEAKFVLRDDENGTGLPISSLLAVVERCIASALPRLSSKVASYAKRSVLPMELSICVLWCGAVGLEDGLRDACLVLMAKGHKGVVADTALGGLSVEQIYATVWALAHRSTVLGLDVSTLSALLHVASKDAALKTVSARSLVLAEAALVTAGVSCPSLQAEVSKRIESGKINTDATMTAVVLGECDFPVVHGMGWVV